VSNNENEAGLFLSLVARMQAKDTRLTSLQAALIVAAEHGIARDSRTFARTFGVAHALVLRELNALCELKGPLLVISREARTLRTHYGLRDGETLSDAGLVPHGDRPVHAKKREKSF